MPLIVVGLLCGMGGLVSGWFAARQAERYLYTAHKNTGQEDTGHKDTAPTTGVDRQGRVIICFTCAVTSAILGVRFAGQTVLASYLVLAALLTALSWIDFKTHRLPRQLTYPGALVCLVLLVYAAWIDHLWSHLLAALAGGALAFGLMWLAWWASRGQLGDGDVRLAPLLGINLGFLTLTAAPIGLAIGFVLGAIASLIGLTTQQLTRSSRIPFGPFLALGTVLTLLWYG